MAYAVVALALVAAPAAAQRGGNAPIAPSSAIGPVTNAATLAVMGLTSIPDGSGTALPQHNALWMGATQPLGRVGRVHLTAIGTGNYLASDAVNTTASVEGLLALRARSRVGDNQIWSAVSYGRTDLNGDIASRLRANAPSAIMPGFDGARVDTTVSRRTDVGNIGRAEAGILRTVSGVELSFGFSVERATRVTTQTIRIDQSNPSLPLLPAVNGTTMTQTLRAVQRRDIATSIASAGFNTGAATWLFSVSAPVATWITSDALSPKSRVAPTIASLAVVQPLTAWLSIVGAASTYSVSAGSTAFRDDLGEGQGRNFAPVVALGVRISRLPFRGRGDDTPSGILSFETRTIGSVDSAAVDVAAHRDDADTLRVVLLIDAPRAETVDLMGDATQWTIAKMSRTKSGRWRAELKLSPGMHRLTVRADGGTWIAPPGLPIGNDDYGTPVGVIVVRGKP